MQKPSQYSLLFLFTYLIIEGMAFIGLMVLSSVKNVQYSPIGKITTQQADIIKKVVNSESDYFAFSSELGWTIKPNGKNNLYQANSKGHRSSREYHDLPGDSVVRIASFGDSFTHSDDVSNHATWQAQMERLDPQLEVLNYGVSGFGPGQAYLRYKVEQASLNAKIVLIGYMSENLYRSVNVFRPFYSPNTALPLAKPRFSKNDSGLELKENPFQIASDYNELLSDNDQAYQALAEHDFYAKRKYRVSSLDFSPTFRIFQVLKYSVLYKYKYASSEIELAGQYNVVSEAFQTTAAVLKSFNADVVNSGAMPIVIIFPTKDDLNARYSGGQVLYNPLIEFLSENKIQYIDLATAFEDLYDPSLADRIHKTHFTEYGNGIIAAFLNSRLANFQ